MIDGSSLEDLKSRSLPLAFTFFWGENGLNAARGALGSTARDVERRIEVDAFAWVDLGGVDGEAANFDGWAETNKVAALESRLYSLYLSAG